MSVDQIKKSRRLLMISTDRSIFNDGSAVQQRQVEYAKDWDEVHIIVVTNKKYSEISLGKNVWVYPSSSNLKFLYPLDVIRLGRFIIQRKNITNLTCQDPFFTALAGTSLKRRFNIPLEIQVHTDIGSPFFTYNIGNKIRKVLALSYLLKADHIRVVSSRIKKYLIEKLGIPETKIEIRPIKIDVQAIRDGVMTVDLYQKYPQFKKIVLMASRLEAEKNIQLAINAWKEVVKKYPMVGLLIVGKGSMENKLKKMVRDNNLNNSVLFEPWVDRATLVSYYKTSDLFLNTSLYEGYGMTLVEAQAAECPIVSTDVGVAREVGATIVSTDKVEELTQVIVAKI